MTKKFIILLILLTALLSCKEPFDIKDISGTTNYLIVEGIINTAGPTNIFLSRTLKLTDKGSVKNELKAQIQVESEAGGVFPLVEKGSGLYNIAQLNLNNSQKYRLRIKTSAGKEYVSDFTPVKETPLIDSVNWVREKDGVGIYANAHDDKKNTRYYQWDYEETWELHSYTISFLTYNGTRVIDRDPLEIPKLFDCWKNQRSAEIIIGSTAKLSNDVIYLKPLTLISNGTEKLGVRYSILVRQYAITPEAYEYLSLMKKNSEQKGSFFDVQPSDIKGNIHNVTDPNETVIGFVQAASVLEKRIFINNAQVPKWGFNLGCSFKDVPSHPDSLRTFLSPFSAYYYIASSFDDLTRKYASWNSTCMDCRLRGGNNDKPAFW